MRGRRGMFRSSIGVTPRGQATARSPSRRTSDVPWPIANAYYRQLSAAWHIDRKDVLRWPCAGQRINQQKQVTCWECVLVDMALIVVAVVALASAVTLLLAKPKKKRERPKEPTNAP
jgi:hypothetical protein